MVHLKSLRGLLFIACFLTALCLAAAVARAQNVNAKAAEPPQPAPLKSVADQPAASPGPALQTPATGGPATKAVTTTPAKNKKKPDFVQVAFFQLEAEGVEKKVATIVTEMFLTEMYQMKGIKVIGSKDIDAMLGYEQKKQVAGCTDTSCMVSIGGALGVDKIMLGSVGKLGTSYTINMKLINISNSEIEAVYKKRMKGGNEEDFLDIIPEALAALFPAYFGEKGEAKNGPPVQVLDLQRTPSQVQPPPGSPSPSQDDKAVGARHAVPMSHAGKVLLSAKGLAELNALGFAGVVGIGYGAAEWAEVGVSGVFFQRVYGGAINANFIIYNNNGVVKPAIGVRIPIYYSVAGSGGLIAGAGATVGVIWDFLPWMGLVADAGAEYYFKRPVGTITYLPFAELGLQFRL